MSLYHETKVAGRIHEVAAEFLGRHPVGEGLVTVTGTKLSSDEKRAIILVSVLPAALGRETLDALHHAGHDLREYLKLRLKLGRLPYLDFELDPSC